MPVIWDVFCHLELLPVWKKVQISACDLHLGQGQGCSFGVHCPSVFLPHTVLLAKRLHALELHLQALTS